MDTQSKKILIVNLTKQEFEIKAFTELNKYVGGVCLGRKLLQIYQEGNPVVLSVGPLNGFFPFASKTSVMFYSDEIPGEIKDLYIGGSLSYRIRFSGLDSIVLVGQAKNPIVLDILDGQTTFKQKNTDLDTLGLPGKRSVLNFDDKEDKLRLDEHFTTPTEALELKLVDKRVYGAVITGTKVYTVKDTDRYQELYSVILSRVGEVAAKPGQNPSCSGCTIGCDKAQVGETGGDLLVHSLVSCQYASKIYKDIGIVFSCLNVLGYDYTHEDLENLPKINSL